jgi:hypothetical protein
LTVLFAGIVSCETETELVEIPNSTIEGIVNAALNSVPTPPTADEIAAAVENAISDDIEDAVNEATAEEPAPATITHSGVLTTDEQWLSSSIHILDGRVVVPDGIKLNIEAGAVIKGKKSADPTKASALLVARGGKLFAIGTADKPIIMTSEDDPIKVDQTYDAGAVKLTANDMALWGGLLVCGRAKISDKTNSGENIIEGIPASVSYGKYGGDNDNDNSGTIEYISLRHGGTVIGADNEINGITLAGVGKETVFNNIEIFANKDDGVEFFGGSVNANNILVYAQGDDAIDTDEAYSGDIKNVVVIGTDDSNATDTGGSGMELSGRLGNYEASKPSTISDASIHVGLLRGALYLKDDLYSTLTNFYITGYPASKGKSASGPWNHNERSLMAVASDAAITANDGSQSGTAAADANGVTFSDFEIETVTGVTLNDIFSDASYTGFTTDATLVTGKSSGQGADTSVFSWTKTSMDGLIPAGL